MNRVLHRFPGGLRLPRYKDLSKGSASVFAGLPERLVLPLRQHVGTSAAPVVRVGEAVLKGQRLAEGDSYVSVPLHAPTSGRVLALEPRPVAGDRGEALCLVMEPDGRDAWVERSPLAAALEADPATLRHRIRDAGIVGMGGAGFPTHVKVTEGMGRAVDTLIINGVECEPYVSCDDRLIRERTAEVVGGARVLRHAVHARHCIIAVEEDMAEALAALQAAAGPDLEVLAVPAVYPAGGEKQLIRTLTGLEVPAGGLPIHIGILMHNVATAAAVWRAVAMGEPLISRMVTLSGDVQCPGNRDVLLGTPVAALLEPCGPASGTRRILMGGPMMGRPLGDLAVPVVKTSNCILVLPERPAAEPLACIRCAECDQVCPVGLQPQALFAAGRAEDWEAMRDLHLFECIECACCDAVCPSGIALTAGFHRAKALIDAEDRARWQADHARQRYRARNARLGASARPGAETTEPPSPADSADGTAADDRSAVIAAAIARSRARRARLSAGDEDVADS